MVTNATGVTWKRAVGALSMLSEFPVADTFGRLFRDPFEFVETDNATKSRMNKSKQWNWLGNKPQAHPRSSEVCMVVNF